MSEARVVVVTRDRTESLRRTLSSILEHARQFGRGVTISVFDDSRSAAGRRACVKEVCDVKELFHCDIVYSDRGDRVHYARALSDRCGVDFETALFALLGPRDCDVSIGATRNTALLASSGKKILFVDDDVLLHPVAVAQKPGVRCTSEARPVLTHKCGSYGAALDRCGEVTSDILDLYSRYLGYTVVDCLRTLGESLKTEAHLPGTAMSPHSYVVMSQFGIVGDLGQASPSWVLTSSGDQRKVLLSSADRYEMARRSRFGIRVADVTTFTDSPFCMTYATGVDGRMVLPPFIPLGRNSDGAFGVLVRALYQHSCTVHLAVGVAHNKSSSVYDPGQIWADAGRLRFADLLSLLIGHARFGDQPSSVRDGYAHLGASLMECAARPDLNELLRFVTRSYLAAKLKTLEGLLQAHAYSPPYWAEDAQRATRHLRAQIGSEDPSLVSDLNVSSADDRLQLIRGIVGRFGTLLKSWPSMQEAAQAMPRPCMPLRVLGNN